MMLVLNINLDSDPIKLPPDSRRSQLLKLNPLREDLEAYMMHVQRIVELLNGLIRDARGRIKTSIDETEALHKETRTQLAQRERELLAKVRDDYARLIDPLTEYREVLISERDALLADFKKEYDKYIKDLAKGLWEAGHQGRQWYDEMDRSLVKHAKDAEHEAYLDLKKITNEKRFGCK